MHKAKNIIHFMPFLYHFNKHSVCRGSPMTTNIYIYIYIYVYIYIYIYWKTKIAVAWRTVHEYIVADAFRSKKSSSALLVQKQQTSQKCCLSSRNSTAFSDYKGLNVERCHIKYL